MKEHFKTMCTRMILGVLCIACTMSAVSAAQVGAAGVSFDSARPIWPADRDTEKNLFVGFRALLDGPAQQIGRAHV